MDKFVVREDTWKTINYAVNKAKFSKTTKKVPTNEIKTLCNKQTLIEIQQDSIVGLKENHIVIPKLLTKQQVNDDASLVYQSDSGISSTSPSEGSVENNENVSPPLARTWRKNLGKIHDYVNERHSPRKQQESLASQRIMVYEAPAPNSSEFDAMLFSSMASHTARMTPQQSNENTPSHSQRARIREDFNSPSATLRMRAMQALKNPTANPYQIFDVSHSEQSIITEAERQPAQPAPSLQELMRNIVVYVEIRSGEDNRSAGVRKVIAEMGARVNDKLLRDTTHVVFKDGLLSTYRKAKNRNIPIVSILWIEACKTHRRICNPEEYPISDIDRYENPEYYEKMKRVKSMQPDSECNKRVRAKPATPKELTPRAVRLMAGSHSITAKINTEKTDCKQTLKKTTESNKEKTAAKNSGKITQFFTPVTSAIMEGTHSPATQFLKRVESNCITPTENELQKNVIIEQGKNLSNTVEHNVSEINKNKMCNDVPTGKLTTDKGYRRRTLYFSARETSSMQDTTIVPIQEPKSQMQSCENSNSNNTIHMEMNMSTDTPTLMKKPSTEANQVESPHTPQNVMSNAKLVNALKDTRNIEELSSIKKPDMRRRRTTYTVQPIDLADVTLRNKNLRRNTLLKTTMLNDSIDQLCATLSTTSIPEASAKSNKVDIEIVPKTASLQFDSARKPNRRRTVFEAKMDIITEQLQNINRSARRSMLPHETVLSNVTPVSNLDNVKPTDTSVGTPTNIVTKKKRKLFAPNHNDSLLLLGTPPPAPSLGVQCETLPASSVTAAAVKDAATTTSPCIQKKRRRTLMPLTQTCCKSDNADSEITPKHSQTQQRNITSAVNNKHKESTKPTKEKASQSRRSLKPKPKLNATSTITVNVNKTDEAKNDNNNNNKNTDQNDKKECKEIENTVSSTSNKVLTEKRCAQRRSTMDFVDVQEKAQTLDNDSEKSKKLTKQRTPLKFMVCTNMHKVQCEIIRQAIKKLGGFVLENIVGENTTHVVSLEPRRTMKLLRGLVRGLWILRYSWITDSLAAGHWLDEEPYELADFSNAIKICRAERQAFGKNYRCELFTTLGAFYISSFCGPLGRDLVCELVDLGGGQLVDKRDQAKYLVSSVQRGPEDKIHITPKWILDSITQMQLQPHHKYLPVSQNPTDNNRFDVLHTQNYYN